MVAQKRMPYVTPEEYLECEDRAETKHEYHDGVIVAMAGASPEHNEIAFNLAGALGPQLQSGSCRGFASDLRVYVPACNRYFYPDLPVVCGEPQYQNLSGLRSLLNPVLIVEVLSASTERDDRGDKFACYQTLPSLSVYVLVAQDRPRIEIFTRQADSAWRYESFNGLEAVAPLPAIGCQLRLADVYARISFPPPPEAERENVTA